MKLDELVNYLSTHGYTLSEIIDECTDLYGTAIEMTAPSGYTVTIESSCTDESYADEIERKRDILKANDLDYTKYNVLYAYFQTFFNGTNPHLVSDPDQDRIILVDTSDGPASHNEYPLTLEYIARLVTIQNMRHTDYILEFLPKLQELTVYVRDVVEPVLARADYVCRGSSLLSNVFCFEDAYNALFTFTHKSQIYYARRGQEFDIYYDYVTGKFCFSEDDIDIFNKTQDELWDIFMKKLWKKEARQFEYLYNPEKTIESYEREMDISRMLFEEKM